MSESPLLAQAIKVHAEAVVIRNGEIVPDEDDATTAPSSTED